ncbi:hypothetical protein [Rhodopirellula bahusiensis]|uniref:hypothetical protein n=1 Tax=Rhodopirellula bahusiensis TaxID=2014065 RepID=UPI00329A6F6A
MNSDNMETWILHESNEKANSLRKRIRELGLDCPPERLVELEPGSETTVDPFAGERLVFLVLNQIQPEHFAVLYALKHAGDCKVVVVATVVNPDSILELFRSGAPDFVRWGETVIDEVGKVISRLRSETVHKRCDGKMLAVIPTASVSDSNLLSCNLAATDLCEVGPRAIGGGDRRIRLEDRGRDRSRGDIGHDANFSGESISGGSGCLLGGVNRRIESWSSMSLATSSLFRTS